MRDVQNAADTLDDESTAGNRSRLFHVLASALTTVAAAGIVTTLITGAQAEPVHPASASASSVSDAFQRYEAPAGFDVKKPHIDHYSAVDPVSSASGGGAAGHTASVSLPSGPVTPAGEAQAYAAQLVASHGWPKREFSCLVLMWGRESGWNAHAGSPGGPYGIPQAYPGSKMASAGAGWLNDYRVQIRWGLGYITGRYGTPCGAWSHWQTTSSY